MRNILMVGTAQAQAPRANGVQQWIPEDLAILFAGTGEMNFLNPADARMCTAARQAELANFDRWKYIQMWANINGSFSIERNGVARPTDAEADRRYGKVEVHRAEAARYI